MTNFGRIIKDRKLATSDPQTKSGHCYADFGHFLVTNLSFSTSACPQCSRWENCCNVIHGSQVASSRGFSFHWIKTPWIVRWHNCCSKVPKTTFGWCQMGPSSSSSSNVVLTQQLWPATFFKHCTWNIGWILECWEHKMRPKHQIRDKIEG